MRSLRDLLSELSARALLVVAASSRDPYLAPFIGPARLGHAFVVAPAAGPTRLGFLTPMERGEAATSGLPLLTPEALDAPRWMRDGAKAHDLLAGVISRALHLCELAPGTLALAGGVSAGRMRAACALLEREGWSFVPGEPVVQWLGKPKPAAALAELQRVAAGTMAAMRRVAALLAVAEDRAGELWLGAERLRVGRLRAEVAQVLAAHALEQPESGFLAPAEEGALPHSAGSEERVLRPGESLIVDLFPCGRLFADCTRTFCVGEPPPVLAAAHRAVAGALQLAREQARAGTRGWAIQEAVCAHFNAAGWETPITHPSTPRGYVHGLGHGVGYELHEFPSFRQHAGEEGMLEVGDVFTLEPGLYDPEAGWAVRLEDLHHLGSEGLEILTPLPYALDPRAWG